MAARYNKMGIMNGKLWLPGLIGIGRIIGSYGC